MEKFTGLFTSESVSPGHPDKVCDLIADTLLDAYLEKDPNSHVAIEMLIGRGYVVVGGNVKSSAVIDVDGIVRDTLRSIGYVDEHTGASCDYISVINLLDKQSSDIDNAVLNDSKHQGAGDQGMMFGYASDETPSLMPLAITIAHELVKRATYLRNNPKLGRLSLCNWARPDMKAQVTVNYVEGRPVGIDTVVLSVQHSPDIELRDIKRVLIKQVIKPVLNQFGYACAKHYLVNPSGRFVIGGPVGDCGVVGRKIIVDTYGGYCPHGGGAFSGKDPSKVDRSGAYMARYVAKNIVAAGLADQCQVQLAYAIGKDAPVSVNVDTFGTNTVPEGILVKVINTVFDLTPAGIIKSLDLLRPIYHLTSNYGHFGRELPEFIWERTDKVDSILSVLEQMCNKEVK